MKNIRGGGEEPKSTLKAPDSYPGIIPCYLPVNKNDTRMITSG